MDTGHPPGDSPVEGEGAITCPTHGVQLFRFLHDRASGTVPSEQIHLRLGCGSVVEHWPSMYGVL